MGAIWVTEQGAELGLDHDRLVVRLHGQELAAYPLGHLERVMLLGNVSVTTPAIHRLGRSGTEVVFLGIDGRYYARMVGDATPHTALRRQQYARQGDAHFSLRMAQRMVAAKLRNERVLLQRHARAGGLDLRAEIDDLAVCEERTARTRTLHALLGVEGSATARYFGAYRQLLAEPWRFARRTRRPPTDPTNVLLSLGYTLLTRAAESAVEAVGLDPYLGFLHQEAYNRPSLALDIVEEFRPVIDGLVLHAIGHRLISTDDFRPGGEGERPLVLEREALKRFIVAYEERMGREIVHPRMGGRMALWRFLELQAREVARCARDGDADYQATVFR